MDDHDLTSEGRLLGAVLVGFLLVVTLAGIDVVSDLHQGASPGHVLGEGGAIIVALVGSVVVARRLLLRLRRWRAAVIEVQTLTAQLEATAAMATRWRAEAHDLLAGLGAALDLQFERWSLSPAEKEVALLLLKGLSHKELARIRSVSEATARQQARAVYKKAGLSGRHDLAAFFLEDLLLPRGNNPLPDPPT